MDSPTTPANHWPAPSFSELPEREVEYLWEPYFPHARFTLLEGDCGAGKTWIAADLAAQVSRQEGKVLIFSSADALESVFKPRLKAAGADLSRIKAIELSRILGMESEGERHVSVMFLSGYTSQECPDLVILDSIEPYVAKKAARFSEVLRDLAIEHGCTILAVRRLPRTPSGRLARTGPEDISFWAESIVVCGKDPEDPRKRILAHARSVHAAEGESVEFTIEDGRIQWGSTREMTAEELLHPPKGEIPDHPSAFHKAREFLKRTLADGRLETKRVLEGAALEGIRKKTLLRAKKSLGVQSTKNVWDWLWVLPKEDEIEAEKKDGHVGHLPGNTPVGPLKLNRAERRRLEREERKEAERMEARG
ncbi:MAG: AAA family ATPase [Bdellovibrionota bacterium]